VAAQGAAGAIQPGDRTSVTGSRVRAQLRKRRALEGLKARQRPGSWGLAGPGGRGAVLDPQGHRAGGSDRSSRWPWAPSEAL
jgi:hypothetical protein